MPVPPIPHKYPKRDSNSQKPVSKTGMYANFHHSGIIKTPPAANRRCFTYKDQYTQKQEIPKCSSALSVCSTKEVSSDSRTRLCNDSLYRYETVNFFISVFSFLWCCGHYNISFRKNQVDRRYIFSHGLFYCYVFSFIITSDLLLDNLESSWILLL